LPFQIFVFVRTRGQGELPFEAPQRTRDIWATNRLMPKQYTLPFAINATILARVAQISDLLGRWSARIGIKPSPTLRRVSRIRSVQASLAIENNSLTLEQVTAVLEGRSVLAPPHDVQEVRNAFVAYEKEKGGRVNYRLNRHSPRATSGPASA
jgi:hypothetical protein